MREELLARIKQSDDLPPLPEVITTLRKMIEDNNTGIDDVARVIQSDPVLTGRLIRMANSVFGRGTTYHANSITKALGRLGLKMAMDLAYSLNLPNMFKPNDVVDQRLFWRYSLARGIVSSKLAQHCGATRDQMSHAYLGGLMKKLGVLVFSNLIPKEYEKFLRKVQKQLNKRVDAGVWTPGKELNLELLEMKKFGITHVELGASFIRQWWPVEEGVLQFIEYRPDELALTLSDSVEIAKRMLFAEHIPNGIFVLRGTLTPEYFAKLGINEFQYSELKVDLSQALGILN